MTAANAKRRQEVLFRRLKALGLAPERVAGGAALSATLPLGPEPFETPSGPRPLGAARFYTVDHDRAKFFSPRAFAYLPLIRILDCEKIPDIEDRLRDAWSNWISTLQAAREWLKALGGQPLDDEALPLCRFSLGLEDPRALAVALEPGRIALPSRGPLTGLTVAGAEDRVYRTRAPESAVDLELEVTARLERLARARRRTTNADVTARIVRPSLPRPMPALLVGSAFVAQENLRQSLRVHGFDAHTVRSIPEALEAFRHQTFDAVLVEARLDRADGAELIPALRSAPGILELPIAVLDDRVRPHRRDAARRAGATAYWAVPVEAGRIVPPLGHMLSALRRRRFTRYPVPLSISWAGCEQPGVASGLNRGGLFVRTTTELQNGRFAIHVADGPLGNFTIHAELEALHHNMDPVAGPDGVGMRFRGFDDEDEAKWIEYLLHLHTESARG